MKQYETIIGLEVHVELATRHTRTKISAAAPTDFGGPNTHTCPGVPQRAEILSVYKNKKQW